MIEAADFVGKAGEAGFSVYAGVPCSFLTPLINHVINDDRLTYISSANEGDAVATAAGAALAGRGAVAIMQNSGLGNAVSPITSLTHVFKIPLLLIVTLRGEPGVNDEPQHELMGGITEQLLELMQIKWEYFPAQQEQIEPALRRATTWLGRESRPYAFLVKKNTVATGDNTILRLPPRKPGGVLREEPVTAGRPSRSQVLERVIEQTPEADSIVVATTGYTGRELYALSDRGNHLYMVGSMGCASSLGLGLALAQPDLKVVVLDGDGAALMRMGNLATVGSYGMNNLVHILLDNEAHESTGAQATVSGRINFTAVAAACGYSLALTGSNSDIVDQLCHAEGNKGARFGQIKIERGTLPSLPRPGIKPDQVLRRLMQKFGFEFPFNAV